MLKSNKKNKKAVSVIISYVLLISITLSLSVLVFNWLKFNIDVNEEIDCDENVALAIKNFSYDKINHELNLTVINKGLFNIYGFYTRVNDNLQLTVANRLLDDTGIDLKVGEKKSLILDTTKDYKGAPVDGVLYFIEVQPYTIEDSVKILCKNAVVKRDIFEAGGL